jgi:hypothetical protein
VIPDSRSRFEKRRSWRRKFDDRPSSPSPGFNVNRGHDVASTICASRVSGKPDGTLRTTSDRDPIASPSHALTAGQRSGRTSGPQ